MCGYIHRMYEIIVYSTPAKKVSVHTPSLSTYSQFRYTVEPPNVTGSEKTTVIVQLRKFFFRRRTEGLCMRYCLNFV